MSDFKTDGGTTRDDLMQRLALIEAMIAEGRQTTIRCGWMFVLWGVVNVVGIGWQYLQPHSEWVWPVCLAAGLAIQFVGVALRKGGSGRSKSMACRSVEAVWSMMGVAMGLYVGAALFRHYTWQLSYLAAIQMIVGLAHAISAVIVRWRVQALVAGLWWVGGVAIFFVHSARPMYFIFLPEMLVGMIAFGLYAMVLDRRNGRMGAHV
jgi:hypothetical protein